MKRLLTLLLLLVSSSLAAQNVQLHYDFGCSLYNELDKTAEADGRATFSGFFDFWREWRPWQRTSHIFLAEPQLWYNFNRNQAEGAGFWSVGAECELSNNFVGKGFYAIPTLAVKWTF